MKKAITLLAIVCVITAMMTGCANISANQQESPNMSETRRDPYDAFANCTLVKAPKTDAMPAGQKLTFRSLGDYAEYSYNRPNSKASGALAEVECIDVDYYVKVTRDGEFVLLNVQSIAKCKVLSVLKTYKDSELQIGASVALWQNVGMLPQDPQDTCDMLLSFGAVYRTDEDGNIVGIDLDEGVYPISPSESVEYRYISCYADSMPLEQGNTYVGLIEFAENICYMSYTSNLEKFDRVWNSYVADEIREKFETYKSQQSYNTKNAAAA